MKTVKTQQEVFLEKTEEIKVALASIENDIEAYLNRYQIENWAQVVFVSAVALEVTSIAKRLNAALK